MVQAACANKKLITGYSIYRPGGLPTSAVWSMESIAGSVGHRAGGIAGLSDHCRSHRENLTMSWAAN